MSRVVPGRASLAICLGLCWLASPAMAQVPRIQGQGTAASGMGNAFAAQADDPSALHYNPAGMTQLRGLQVMVGGLLTGGTTRFTNSVGASATGDRDGSFAWPPPAHVFLVANMKDLGVTALGDLTAGIGVTVPFGSIMRWPDTVPFRAVTVFNAFPLFDVKPTLAYPLTRNLSVGVGADIYTFSGLFGEGHAESQSISPGGPLAPLLGPAGSKVEVYGRDTAVGFNVGLLYTAIRNSGGQPLANVAVVYRSQATLNLTGALMSNGIKVQDATSTLVLPQVITGGVALWPVRNEAREWKLEVDVDYVGWKSVGNLDIRLANGTVILQPQNWKSTYTTMVGTEYRWSKLDAMPEWEWAVRGGYTYQPTQMPDLTFNPGIASADVHILSTGAGVLCKEHGSLLGIARCGGLGMGLVPVKGIGLDLSFQTSLYEPRTISGNSGIRAGVNGLYKSLLYTGGLSIRLHF
jgi:long-chain fatty acid transport protein